MKRITAATVLFMIISGCAPYKQLKPKIPLVPQEGDYIELKRDAKKNFELKKEKKYYIAFPAPQYDHFYLVLDLPRKNKFRSFLTDTYEKKNIGAKIADESPAPDTQSVYPINRSAGSYYWLVENGAEDLILTLRYRYAPQWRYKFENKHLEYLAALEDNRVDRTIFNTLGATYHFNGFDFAGALREVDDKSALLGEVHGQLLELESIFPPTILNSSDKAYLDFKDLKEKLEEELAFQTNYRAVLEFFNAESVTRGNTGALIDKTGEFVDFYRKKERFTESILEESRTILNDRLNQVVPFYDRLLAAKDDAGMFDSASYHLAPFSKLDTLYRLSGLPEPQDFTVLYRFISGYQEKSRAVSDIRNVLKEIAVGIEMTPGMPSNDFYGGIVKQAEGLSGMVPPPLDNSAGKYMRYACAQELNRIIGLLGNEVREMLEKYRLAQGLVLQLNALKDQGDFRAMLGILKQYPHLDFLLAMYKPLDRMSLDQQVSGVRGALERYDWPRAESGLAALHKDNDFIDPQAIHAEKSRLVDELERELVGAINSVSRNRVQKFLEENVDSIGNVDSLYSDSVWVPAYTLTFTSGNRTELARRNQELADYLTKLKEHDFPSRAVTLLYDQFTRNPNDNDAVLRARAIVAHGERYKGEDQQVKRRAAEVNPWAAKWIVKPTEYRRIHVVPLTDNKRGKNRYVFRLNIRIPTEAKFPVYDVNIKLPPEIARKASEEQWYENMTLNKKVLKNEGRFMITAPTAENNYECQISPMQVTKDESNILEVYFWHDSFKVHPVSVMVQKPIIKKN